MPLNPVQQRRLLARTLSVALGGGPAPSPLVERWASADASDEAWLATLTWDGVGAAVGWALGALDLRAVAPPELDAIAADAFEDARRQSVSLAADLERLGAEFEAAEIRAIALKGSALLVGNMAPALGIRWMSDIDLLVPESHAEQAAWVLESLDYVRGVPRDPNVPAVFRPYHETFASPDGRIVELHWRLGPTRWGAAASAERWFASARPSAVRGVSVPSAADLFWHVLLHDARNHAWSSGSLRAAFDLALVARSESFGLEEVLARVREDPRPEPLLDGIADAANLSPILASGVEPSVEPRYLRLARWRDALGRRRWKTERIAEAIAWGAALDRARRFGGWRGLLERAIRVIPEAAPGAGAGPMLKRAWLNTRHAAFVGALAASHFVTITVRPGRAAHRLPRPAPRGRA